MAEYENSSDAEKLCLGSFGESQKKLETSGALRETAYKLNALKMNYFYPDS